MSKIPAPKHPGRDILSHAALKADYQTLADRAQSEGWSRVDIAIDLMVQDVGNHLLGMNANVEMFERGTGVVLHPRKPH
ncbi:MULTISPECIES: hypothetical protein [unclassified Ensifer]|uniref:hypothetical protein n=1 Tax=unclassified Ensifer TaxID=2633371 RepID=UPI00070E818A|nr:MULTISPECIES: hypothetical protein [unclassified Ensifer]KQW62683.1 hypothetical protein ASD02_00685 [Ensifer sp. Root1252]KRC83503.1 hypothetical protein ASE32_00680 [Ensifer sp. Root231]KRC86591.1 hypothetical protein ASE47_16970 [Ensifer sp. Root258]